MRKEITFDTFIRAITALVIVLIAYLLIRKLSNVLLPFLIAWLVAYILYPIVCFFQYKCRVKSRILCIGITLALVICVAVTAFKLLVPPIIDEFVRLKSIVGHYVTAKTDTGSITYEIEQYIKDNIDIEQIYKSLSFSDMTGILEERVPQLLKIVSSSISALIAFVCSLISVVYLFFILKDYEVMNDGLIKLIPKSKQHVVVGILRDVKIEMNKYFRCQSLIALIVGILFTIGFVIIDFPLAIPLGLFIGVLNLVPYMQIVGFIPTLVLVMLKAHDSGQDFWIILLVTIAVFVVVQVIQDGYLVPLIMGKVTGMNAAVILLSLSVWGTLLGFVGLIIALPLTTMIISYYKRFIMSYNDDSV